MNHMNHPNNKTIVAFLHFLEIGGIVFVLIVCIHAQRLLKRLNGHFTNIQNIVKLQIFLNGKILVLRLKMEGLEEPYFDDALKEQRFILQLYKNGKYEGQYPTYRSVSDQDFVDQLVNLERELDWSPNSNDSYRAIWTIPSNIKDINFVVSKLLDKFGDRFFWRISSEATFCSVRHTLSSHLVEAKEFRILYPSK